MMQDRQRERELLHTHWDYLWHYWSMEKPEGQGKTRRPAGRKKHIWRGEEEANGKKERRIFVGTGFVSMREMI